MSILSTLLEKYEFWRAFQTYESAVNYIYALQDELETTQKDHNKLLIEIEKIKEEILETEQK